MKTFKELFANTGIEPTTDENGGVHYNFNATLKKEPIKTAMQELQKLLINKIIKKENGHLNDIQEGFNNGLICALEYIEEALEKEKEQMLSEWRKGFEDAKYIYNQTK